MLINELKPLFKSLFTIIKYENKFQLLLFVIFFIRVNVTFNYLFLSTYFILLILALIKLISLIIFTWVTKTEITSLYFNDILDSRIINYIYLMRNLTKKKISFYNISSYILFYLIIIIIINIFQAPFRLIIFYIQLYKIIKNFILLKNKLIMYQQLKILWLNYIFFNITELYTPQTSVITIKIIKFSTKVSFQMHKYLPILV